MRSTINLSPRRMAMRVLLGTALLLVATILAGAISGSPQYHFGEGRIMTFFSGFLLLAVAWLSFQMRQLRHVAPNRTFWKPRTAIWGIMSLGFAFLALDELAQIHESMDKVIHTVFRMEQTQLTSRIDDLIVGLYGVIGIAAIWIYRKELLQHRQALPFLIVSFILFFLMIAVDLLGRHDMLELLFQPETARRLKPWVTVKEESLKICSGTCFVLAFYSALHKVREELASSSIGQDVSHAGKPPSFGTSA